MVVQTKSRLRPSFCFRYKSLENIWKGSDAALIYLDNAATTPVDGCVIDRMMPFMKEEFGNPDSTHDAASVPADAVRKAADQVSECLLHAGGHGRVIFTSGGTEANNMAFGLAGNLDPLCMNIITSATEHKSVLEPAKSCVRSKLRILKPGSKGYIAARDIDENEIPAFTLVSLMHMNNETGTLNEINEIGQKLRQFKCMDVFFHVDCVQSAGALPIKVHEMNADLVSVSSHKIHGPKGVGCLWVSDRVLERVGDRKTLSIIQGGSQQGGFRAGTLNVPGIIGFGEAARSAGMFADEYLSGEDSVSNLSCLFRQSLDSECERLGIRHKINFYDPSHQHGKVLSITFPDADSETVVMVASQNGLCVSNGAACNSFASEPSYVLLNSGMSPELARNTVRVSFSRHNTKDDCINGAVILAEAVNEVLCLTNLG